MRGMKEKLIDRIAELTSQIDTLTKEKASVKQELANISTEFKIGDRIQIDTDKTGTIYQITSVQSGYNPSMPNHYGAKIKKDGTPGKCSSRIYCWGNSKLMRVP